MKTESHLRAVDRIPQTIARIFCQIFASFASNEIIMPSARALSSWLCCCSTIIFVIIVAAVAAAEDVAGNNTNTPSASSKTSTNTTPSTPPQYSVVLDRRRMASHVCRCWLCKYFSTGGVVHEHFVSFLGCGEFNTCHLSHVLFISEYYYE